MHLYATPQSRPRATRLGGKCILHFPREQTPRPSRHVCHVYIQPILVCKHIFKLKQSYVFEQLHDKPSPLIKQKTINSRASLVQTAKNRSVTAPSSRRTVFRLFGSWFRWTGESCRGGKANILLGRCRRTGQTVLFIVAGVSRAFAVSTVALDAKANMRTMRKSPLSHNKHGQLWHK